MLLLSFSHFLLFLLKLEFSYFKAQSISISLPNFLTLLSISPCYDWEIQQETEFMRNRAFEFRIWSFNICIFLQDYHIEFPTQFSIFSLSWPYWLLNPNQHEHSLSFISTLSYTEVLGCTNFKDIPYRNLRV